MAIETSDDDPFNPFAYAGGGTQGFIPLEQIPLKSDRTYVSVAGEKLGEKTNVWGIGAIIMRLMSRDPDPNTPTYVADDGSLLEETPEWKHNGDDEATYSRHLQRLVRQCVACRPAERPTLRKLQRRIEEFTTDPSDWSKGMRQGGMQIHRLNELRYAEEPAKYKLHMSSNSTSSSKRQRVS